MFLTFAVNTENSCQNRKNVTEGCPKINLIHFIRRSPSESYT